MQAHAAPLDGMDEERKGGRIRSSRRSCGPWGLGVIRVADEQERRALVEGDPVIQANVGFRCETVPMLRAILPAL